VLRELEIGDGADAAFAEGGGDGGEQGAGQQPGAEAEDDDGVADILDGGAEAEEGQDAAGGGDQLGAEGGEQPAAAAAAAGDEAAPAAADGFNFFFRHRAPDDALAPGMLQRTALEAYALAELQLAQLPNDVAAFTGMRAVRPDGTSGFTLRAGVDVEGRERYDAVMYAAHVGADDPRVYPWVARCVLFVHLPLPGDVADGDDVGVEAGGRFASVAIISSYTPTAAGGTQYPLAAPQLERVRLTGVAEEQLSAIDVRCILGPVRLTDRYNGTPADGMLLHGGAPPVGRPWRRSEVWVTSAARGPLWDGVGMLPPA
jgi:hypothetical protein